MITKLAIIIIFFFISNTPVYASNLRNLSQDCSMETLTILDDTKSVGANSDPCDELVCSCSIKICIPLCCPHGQKLLRKKCTSIIRNGMDNWAEIHFPKIYNPENFLPINTSHFNFNNLTINPKYFDDHFSIFIHDPCINQMKYRLEPDLFPEDEYKLLTDGSVIRNNEQSISINDYCLSIIDGKTYSVVLCTSTLTEDGNMGTRHHRHASRYETSLHAGLFISLPFLFVTFIIYSTIPELRNLHGFTLRNHIAFLFIGYALLGIIGTCIAHGIKFSAKFCIITAFIIHFSLSSSFFWLNTMCFDIWSTFRGSHGLQYIVKREEKKKYFTYSVFTWTGASFLTAICLIMDFVPQIPSNFIRPQLGVNVCGYITDTAAAIYIYPPMGFSMAFNIYCFISTARRIDQHRKNMAPQLDNINSRRHDDHEQRFSLYLKLFIVMGLNWSLELLLWLLEFAPEYVWYLVELTNSLQGVTIFFTFVWQNKIKNLLWKRLGIRTENRSEYSRSGSNYST